MLIKPGGNTNQSHKKWHWVSGRKTDLSVFWILIERVWTESMRASAFYLVACIML